LVGIAIGSSMAEASTVSELSNQYLTNAGTAAGFDTTKNVNVQASVAGIVNIVLSFVGLAFFIMILYGGIKWMTSAGNEKVIEESKALMVNATIGLIVIMLSYAISYFVLDQLYKKLNCDPSVLPMSDPRCY